MRKKNPTRRELPARRSSSRARRSWWPWLGAGALGLVALSLWRSPAAEKGRPLRLPLEPEEEPELGPFALPQQAELSWIAGPSGSLHLCEINPEGEVAVIFVHELGGRLEHWAGLLRNTGPALRAIAIDLPGHGLSDPPTASANLNDLAGAIGAVLDGLGLRRAVLVGHGIGASASLAYASCHRERVAGLLLVDSGADVSHLSAAETRQLVAQLTEDPHAEMTWQFRQMLGGAPSWVADQVLGDLEAVRPEVLADAVESALAFRPSAALEEFGGPAHCVVGSFGDLPGTLHRSHPDLPVAYVAAGSHWLPLDSPDQVWEVLVDFLAALA